MGLVINGEKVGGLVINGEKVGGMVINGEKMLAGGISVTFTLPFLISGNTAITWQPPTGSRPDIGTVLTITQAYVERILIFRSSPNEGRTWIRLAPNQTVSGFQAGPEFTDQMETNGTITLVASDGTTVATTGISDMTEPYEWTPSNATEILAFANHVVGLDIAARDITVTFFAPS